MSRRFDPESVDLAEVAAFLHARYGASVTGAVVGRTALRDEVVYKLGCSQLDGENLVDTMIGRGFLVQRSHPDGLEAWEIRVR